MANINNADPWLIQPRERTRYEEQFRSLRPVNGIITGDQAKGFLLQSQLPPPVLGQIWSLADTDSDGKMNIEEFSIACKLINLKLRSFELPKTLPSSLLQSASHPPGVVPQQVRPQPPNQIPLVGMALPQPARPQPARPAMPPMMHPPVIPPLPNPALIQHSIPPMVPPMTHPTLPPMVPPMTQPMLPPMIPPMVPPMVPPMSQIMGQSMVSPINQAMVQPMVQQPLPLVQQVQPMGQGFSALPTQGVAALPIRPPSVPLDRAPSIESPLSGLGSPSGGQEWGVPHAAKLRFTQLFNTLDRGRSGFLSGPQARNVMVQSRVPQNVLAQIWSLSDMDGDGKLSCDEFVLALHLCEQAKAGEAIPASLPLQLIPPALRRQRQGSIPGQGQGAEAIDKDAALSLLTTTFEDKRKENFDKGQAELERRRKQLLDIQRKEMEERQRKEKEEEEKRERVRLEQEKRRQAEFERQLQRQREAEQEREESRKRAQEQRESARREMEKQRQLEWEKSRSQELQQTRQREQQNVLKLKAKNQTLGIELSQLNEKVKELSGKISETRLGVSGVKTTIDGMRSTRDTQLHEMSGLKTRLKEQNQRLVAVSQEKSRLEARNKMNQDSQPQEQTQAAFSNKQITLKQLRDRLADLQKEIEVKLEDIENNNSQLGDLKTQLGSLVKECEQLYVVYEDKRARVLEIKTVNARRDPTDFSSSWGAEPAWTEAQEPDWPVEPAAIESVGVQSAGDFVKYRAIYEFVARNGDEISFQPGDIVMVPLVHNAEPGWLAGEIRGHTGWFPESYVEPVGSPGSEPAFPDDDYNQLPHEADTKRPLEEIAELPEPAGLASSLAESASATATGTRLVDEIVRQAETSIASAGEASASATGGADQEKHGLYVALYPYASPEVGDLSFNQSDVILVVKKEGDWWTGVIGDRQGIFPSNYVQPAPEEPSVEAVKPVAAVIPAVAAIPAAEPAAAAVREMTPVSFEPAAVAKSPVTPDFAAMSASTMGKSRKPEIASVIAPYQATSSEQLSLSRGQLVMIRKKTSTGWWEGELQAKGRKRQVGWFPATYVKLMVSGRNTPTSMEMTNRCVTPEFSNPEKVVALFPYTALNADELSFEKDDVILLLSRDEDAWWRGELDGKSGLFPSNYVAAMSAVKLSKTERKRQEHINELIQTEEAYIEDMLIVHDVFEKRLLQGGVLTKRDVSRIFVNWRDIIVCNHTFLRALRVRRDMSAGGIVRMIGDIMCENLPRMTSYVRFCSCQLDAATFLQQLTENSAEFREVQKTCQADPRTKGMPLSSFLIKPMQRITKYPLIIRKILEFTPENHPDRQNLQEALGKAEEFCVQVNEGVREKDNSERLEWLQHHVVSENPAEQIVFNSVTNSVGPRKFLHHGVLRKAKSGKELACFLLNDFLLLTQPSKPLAGTHTFLFDRKSQATCRVYKKPLLLNQLTVVKEGVDSAAEQLRLFDSGSKMTLTLLAPSATERSLWVKRIENATMELLDMEKSRIQRQQSKQAQFGACGRVLVLVALGVGLTPANGKCDAFCEVSMGSQRHRTPVVPATTDPVWNASMQFLVKDLAEDVLCVTVFDHGRFSPDGFLGRTEVRIADILAEARDSKEPMLKHLLLHEVEAGEIRMKLDLRLFDK